MRYAELVQLYFERSSALQWYWTLYVVIVGGLLAFSSLRIRPDAITGVLITVLFVIFANRNLSAIHDTTMQRMATLQAIRDYPAGTSVEAAAGNGRQVAAALEPTLAVPSYNEVRTTHLAGDVLTVVALWAMELRRVRAARGAAVVVPR